MTKLYLSENTELMKEWDWEANQDLNPKEITCGSQKKSGGNAHYADIVGRRASRIEQKMDVVVQIVIMVVG